MAQTAPDFGTILSETGTATSDALQTLWFLANNGIIDVARNLQIVKDRLEPKVLTSAPAGATNNLGLDGSSVIQFTGGTAFNLTGLVAPATGKSRVVIIHVSGTGTVTLKHLVTSVATNQLSLITGADTLLATGKSAIFIYLSSLWRQVA